MEPFRRPMTIAAFIMFAWTAVCWFSQPFDNPFLDLFIFDIDAAIPFAATLILLLAAATLRILRSGGSDMRRLRDWAGANRATLILLVAILLLHLAFELPAIIFYRGANDSDSSTYGIAGYHIADGIGRPMTWYGRHYGGTLIPHITATIHAFAGKSPANQRVVITLFYLGFLAVLFVLVSRVLDKKTALLSAALAAIPPFEVFSHLKHIEFVEIIFWGTISLYLLSRMLERERPGWRQYFWYGAVLGIGLYAHPQAIYYIVTGAALLFIGDKLFFARPQAAAAAVGFALGSVVTFVDIHYHGANPFTHFFSQAADLGALVSRLLTGAWEFLRHVPEHLGLRGDNSNLDLLGPWTTWLVIALFVACVALFIYRCRRELIGAVRLKNLNAGPAMFLIFALFVLLIFAASEQARPPSPFRYSFPLWSAVPVVIAAGLTFAAKRSKAIAVAVALIFAAVFSYSQLLKHGEQLAAEGIWKRWDTFCREQNITRFYGPYWRAYQSSFVTVERVIGSSTYPFAPERYPPYCNLVDNAPAAPAFLIDQSNRRAIAGFEETLRNLDISYRKEVTPIGVLLYGLSERLTPKQLARLRRGRYRSEFSGWTVEYLPASGGGAGARLVKLSIRNSGEVAWLPNGKNGHVELVVEDAGGREIRRQPLSKGIRPGEEISWRILLPGQEIVDGEAVSIRVLANGIILNAGKEPLVLKTRAPVPGSVPGEDVGRAPQASIQLPDGSGGRSAPADYMLFAGWGAVEKGSRGFTLWSAGGESTLGFFLSHPDTVTLVARAFPFRGKGVSKTENSIRVYCNGVRVGRTVHLFRSSRFEIVIPRSCLLPGLNLLRFKYGSVEPEYRRVDGEVVFRYRTRAVAFTRLSIRPSQ